MTDEFDTQAGSEASACPFVAFEDDRDHRSDAPDYRHRCFASAEPEPRSFPHQERYCLSAGFAACPVFLDWARQEAAGVTAASAATSESSRPFDDEEELAPAFLASRPSRSVVSSPVEPTTASKRTAEAAAGLWSSEGISRRNTPTAPPPPSSLQAPSVTMARRGPSHPGWENPPRMENFPRLRSRDEHHSNAPLMGAAIGVAVVFVALVLLPLLLGGHGGTGPGPNASPSAGATGSGNVAVATDTPEPTVTPTPGPSIRVIALDAKKFKNLTQLATYYNVRVAYIVAYNKLFPDSGLQNPDVVVDGMRIYIPPVDWVPPPATPIPAATPTPVATPT